MADNPYYRRLHEYNPLTKARGEDVREDLSAIEAGFAKLPAPQGQGFDEQFEVMEAKRRYQPPQWGQVEPRLINLEGQVGSMLPNTGVFSWSAPIANGGETTIEPPYQFTQAAVVINGGYQDITRGAFRIENNIIHLSEPLKRYDEVQCLIGSTAVIQSYRAAPAVTESKAIPSLLVYYGYPIAYRQLWNVEAVVTEISIYDNWVIGDTYQYPDHEVYEDTQKIVAGVMATGTKCWGYVPIGGSTQNLTIAVIKQRIDMWESLGVDGIFLDEFGFDYQNTRDKQIEIVNYVHDKGMNFIANAWLWSDVYCDHIDELPYPEGDWRWWNFKTWNPDNKTLTRWPEDVYLFENYAVSHTGVQGMWEFHSRVEDNMTFVSKYPYRRIKNWALSVIDDSGTQNQIDYNQLKPFKNLDEFANYANMCAYVHDMDAFGIGGYSFGSAGFPLEYPKFTLPAEAGKPQDAAFDYGNATFSRIYGKYFVRVITDKDNGLFSAGVYGQMEVIPPPIQERMSITDTLGRPNLISNGGFQVEEGGGFKGWTVSTGQTEQTQTDYLGHPQADCCKITGQAELYQPLIVVKGGRFVENYCCCHLWLRTAKAKTVIRLKLQNYTVDGMEAESSYETTTAKDAVFQQVSALLRVPVSANPGDITETRLLISSDVTDGEWTELTHVKVEQGLAPTPFIPEPDFRVAAECNLRFGGQ